MACFRTPALALLCVMQCACVSSFNLDPDTAITKRGERGSMFGFSLAMHRQLVPTDRRMVLVGAPLASKLPVQKSERPGGLYNCTFGSNTVCDRVIFDDKEDPQKENKTDQWMGVTVQSQGPGGKIVTCAHRYRQHLHLQSASETRDIRGRCYVLGQSLKIDESTGDEGGEYSFCQGLPRGHEQYGYCQQGLAATFTKDYHYMIFGAPGGYNWKGIVQLEQRNHTLLAQGFYDDGPFVVKYKTVEGLDKVPVPANSYLGFSLDSGKMITKKGELIVVAGAPRANHSGAVVMLRRDPNTTPQELVTEYIIEGEGLASSFGYDLVVVDINNDGWQDLVVGAPQYFEKNSDIGGAIYVFMNQKGNWDNVIRYKIKGAKDSMFGVAVENLGDINLDGFNDVAVGAPFDDNDAGSVYIYLGSATELKREPSQVLKAKDIKMFGYSLAGNMDLDKNQYPDLAVGSLSDAIVLFRAKPVVNLEKTVTTDPKELDLKNKNCNEGICLQVRTCFKFTSNSKNYSPVISIKYTIHLEAQRKELGLSSRLLFNPREASDTDYESSGILELRKPNVEACVSKGLRLQETLKDKLRGIPITVSVELQKTSRKKRQSSLVELPPVLSSVTPARTEVNFVKEGCGAVCQSNLKLDFTFCSKELNKDVFNPLPIQDGVPVLSISNQKQIALEVRVTNLNGDGAYETVLTGLFPDTLSYSASRTQTDNKNVICLANQKGSQADCELGNPFQRDSEVVFYIILGTGGIGLDTTEVEVTLKLQTTSSQVGLPLIVTKKAKLIIELLLSMSGVANPSQLEFEFTGDVKGESAITSEAEIGNQIDYEFRVINLGKPLTGFGTASLNIQWPKNTLNQKWLLYLMKITTSGIDNIGCSNPEEVNPRRFLPASSLSRNRRDVADKDADSESGILSRFREKRKFQILTCEDGAQCVTIKCPLQGLDSNAVIALRARLWNATFFEDFKEMNYVDVLVKASLSLNAAFKNVVLTNKDAQVRVTVFPRRKTAQFGGVPLWIILVAILLGLLLLALLAVLLWKCGYLKNSSNKADKQKLTSDA